MLSASLSRWYPGSGVVLGCIGSWSLHPYLLSVFDPYFGMHYLVFFLVLHHPDKEERAGCFALIVFLMSCSCDCWCFLALPRGAVVGLQCVIVVLYFQIILTFLYCQRCYLHTSNRYMLACAPTEDSDQPV